MTGWWSPEEENLTGFYLVHSDLLSIQSCRCICPLLLPLSSVSFCLLTLRCWLSPDLYNDCQDATVTLPVASVPHETYQRKRRKRGSDGGGGGGWGLGYAETTDPVAHCHGSSCLPVLTHVVINYKNKRHCIVTIMTYIFFSKQTILCKSRNKEDKTHTKCMSPSKMSNPPHLTKISTEIFKLWHSLHVTINWAADFFFFFCLGHGFSLLWPVDTFPHWLHGVHVHWNNAPILSHTDLLFSF